MTRKWIFLLLVFLLKSLPLQATTLSPIVILSSNSNSYLEVYDALKKFGLQKSEVHILGTNSSLMLKNRTAIAVGSRACRKSVETASINSHIICTFLPYSSYSHIASMDKTQQLRKTGNITALYLDQPLSRQIQLGLLIKPNALSIGTLVSSKDTEQENHFTQVSRKMGLHPRIAHLNIQDNPVRVLGPIIENSDIFLPLPGHSTAVNGASKWILYLTLRNGVPLIGYSKSYADAGAVVALYTSTSQVARDTIQLAHVAETGLPLPPPHYPRNFELSINTIAARNLGIDLPPRDVLHHQLEESEQQP